MIRHERVENADRIVGRNFADLFQISAIAVEDRSALRLSHRVQHHYQALVPARREVGARGMAQMMADLVNALSRESRAVPANLFEQGVPGKNFFVKHRAGRVETENLPKRSV